jgi:hypothetical protein
VFLTRPPAAAPVTRFSASIELVPWDWRLVKSRPPRHHSLALNIYLALTREFNEGGLRAIICSGQAVVLHRLAIMSKDGDWILREDEGSLQHILGVLERHGARYRFGAPLDPRWMAGGWSSHFEFRHEKLRVRTDFFTRPPRIGAEDLQRIWREQAGRDLPFLDLPDLAEMKKTNRERDYAVIGELARRMPDVEHQFLYSRSARDLTALADARPDLARELSSRRPVLLSIPEGRDRLEAALDAERRESIRRNERRLEAYADASASWYALWPGVAAEIADLPLARAHSVVLEKAAGVLPLTVDAPAGGSR